VIIGFLQEPTNLLNFKKLFGGHVVTLHPLC
jgi:hypothetical protein